MKKGPFILLAYFLLLGASSCLYDDCGDISSTPLNRQFEITGFNYRLMEVYLDTNEVIDYEFNQTDSTILYDNYGIELTSKGVNVTMNKNHFSIFPAVYACDPAINYYTLSDISNIEIITHQDFDSTHLAGSNVADLFQVIEGFYLPLTIYTIQEYIDTEAIDTYFKRRESFLFHLNSPPTEEKKYEFTVKITLENAAIDFVEYKTAGVIITNQ